MGSKLELTSDLFSRSDSGFITDELGLFLFFVPVCTANAHARVYSCMWKLEVNARRAPPTLTLCSFRQVSQLTPGLVIR